LVSATRSSKVIIFKMWGLGWRRREIFLNLICFTFLKTLKLLLTKLVLMGLFLVSYKTIFTFKSNLSNEGVLSGWEGFLKFWNCIKGEKEGLQILKLYQGRRTIHCTMPTSLVQNVFNFQYRNIDFHLECLILDCFIRLITINIYDGFG
jgi:hypothetical protein